jgi:hypothetical protein
MPYELFESKTTRLSSPHLSIRRGKLALNADAGNILASAGVEFVHLLWDVAACKIAIQPTRSGDGNAFKLSVPKGKRGRTISAMSFLNYIQWRAREAVIIEVKWNSAECLLEASLPREHIGTAKSGRDGSKRIPIRPAR